MKIEMTTVSLDNEYNRINSETRSVHRMIALDFISRLLAPENVVLDKDAPGYLELQEFSSKEIIILELQAKSSTNTEGLASLYVFTAAADEGSEEAMGLLFWVFSALREARNDHIMTSAT